MCALHVEVEGTGPPLLLLHGFTGSGRSWDSVRPTLRQHARLIVPDLIGHGQSPSPDEPERYTFERCVTDLCAVLDAHGLERVHVLGYSLGGRVALHFALSAPERVAGLLLASASPGLEDATERTARQVADEQLARRIEQHGVAAFVAEWEAQPLLGLAEHVGQEVRDQQHQQRLQNSSSGLANSLRGMGAGRQRSLWAELSDLTGPVHVVVGERDARYRAIGERIRGVLPGASLTVVPGAGHTVHLDQPERFVHWVVSRAACFSRS